LQHRGAAGSTTSEPGADIVMAVVLSTFPIVVGENDAMMA